LSAGHATVGGEGFVIQPTVGILSTGGSSDAAGGLETGFWTVARALRAATPVALMAPVLISPADEAESVALPVSLSWEAVSGAVAYDVEVTTPGTTAPVVDTIGVKTETLIVSVLDMKTEYFWKVRATSLQGHGPFSEVYRFRTMSIVSNETDVLPDAFGLYSNYPNPFDRLTTVTYALPEAVRIRLTVYDTFGRLVATLADDSQPAGHHSVRFSANRLASGVYIYSLQAGTFTARRTMLLVR
ncbi:MAG: T9SS type A sorting domain-containing protein, partial [Rhodothermales bacterium]